MATFINKFDGGRVVQAQDCGSYHTGSIPVRQPNFMMKTEQEISDQIKVMEVKKSEWDKRYSEFLYNRVNPTGNIQMMEAVLQSRFFEHTIKVLRWIKGEQVEF